MDGGITGIQYVGCRDVAVILVRQKTALLGKEFYDPEFQKYRGLDMEVSDWTLQINL